jgi:polyferredoxin
MKKNFLILSAGILLAAFLTLLMLQKKVRQTLSFMWSNAYYYPIYGALVLAFIYLFARLMQKASFKENTIKFVYGILFLPLALFPLVRCYFNIPYIFCRACPRKCPWGDLRPIIIPSFVFMNLDKRFWCFKLCPFGTFQDYQTRVSKKRILLPAWLLKFRYLFLIFTVFVTVVLILNPDFGLRFFVGDYPVVLGTAIVALLIFFLAFLIPRFWCNYFCPIGSFGDLAIKLQNKIKG